MGTYNSGKIDRRKFKILNFLSAARLPVRVQIEPADVDPKLQRLFALLRPSTPPCERAIFTATAAEMERRFKRFMRAQNLKLLQVPLDLLTSAVCCSASLMRREKAQTGRIEERYLVAG